MVVETSLPVCEQGSESRRSFPRGQEPRGKLTPCGQRPAWDPTRLPVIAKGTSVGGIDRTSPGRLGNPRGNVADAAVAKADLDSARAERLQRLRIALLDR